jgi:acetyl-CoA carboxylase carboxyltransferase component
VSRPPEPLADRELLAEREMLEYARRCLAAMRRRARALRAAGADEYAAESVERRLRQRVAALADDGRAGLAHPSTGPARPTATASGLGAGSVTGAAP